MSSRVSNVLNSEGERHPDLSRSRVVNNAGRETDEASASAKRGVEIDTSEEGRKYVRARLWPGRKGTPGMNKSDRRCILLYFLLSQRRAGKKPSATRDGVVPCPLGEASLGGSDECSPCSSEGLYADEARGCESGGRSELRGGSESGDWGLKRMWLRKECREYSGAEALCQTNA